MRKYLLLVQFAVFVALCVVAAAYLMAPPPPRVVESPYCASVDNWIPGGTFVPGGRGGQSVEP